MGSQSILAAYSPAALDRRLLFSAEVDVMPVADDAAEIERLSDYLHGVLGQDSRFQETHGFHVDGVSIDTSVLPGGWVHRLIPAVDPSSDAVGWCLDPHDLAVAKLIAGRPKDLDFVRILVEDRLVDPQDVRDGLTSLDRRPRAARDLTPGCDGCEWAAGDRAGGLAPASQAGDARPPDEDSGDVTSTGARRH